MTVTKSDLTAEVMKRLGCKKSDAAEAVEAVFDMMKGALVKGEEVKIHSFGAFSPRDKKARTGRNPRTGEEIQIRARRVLTFRASQTLKDRLNQSS